MKRILVGLLAAMLAISCVSCGNSDNNGDSSTASSETGNFNKTGLPILNEKETFTIAVQTHPSSKNTYPEKQCVVDTEKATNIHIEWREIPDVSWQEKINLMFTSGDLTDAVWGDVSIANFGEFLLPLNDYIDNYAPYMTKLFEDVPLSKASLAAPDGKIYGLPRDEGTATWNYIAELPLINQEWLTKLNLKMPTSLEELKDVLVAFKTKDPNGNGKEDEIPLSFQQGWGSKIDALFGWFGIHVNDKHISIENDKAVFVPAKEEYYDALVYFHDLYKEGLLNKEGFSYTVEQFQAAARQDPYIFGAMVGSTSRALTTKEDYITIPPFEGTIWDVKTQAFQIKPQVFITTNCKKPEVLLRMFDYINSSFEIGVSWNEGPEGKGFKKTKDGKWIHTVNDTAPEGMTGNDWRYMISTGGRSCAFSFSEDREIAGTDPENRLNQQGDYPKYGPKQYLPSGFAGKENEETRSRLFTDIDTYVQNFKSSSIINGITEKQWEEHLKTLESLKIDEYVSAWQEFYDMKK